MKFPIPILLYHGFGNQSSSSLVGLDLFSRHLDWLTHNGWRSLNLAEFEAAVLGDHDFGSRRFLITFDDNSPLLGQYASEMKSRGFSGAAFVITGKFEHSEAGWLSFDAAAELVRNGTLEACSHTHRHVAVGSRPEELEALREDLQNSRVFLSERLGVAAESLRHLAWPWGRCTADMEAMADSLGFRWQYQARRGTVTHCNRTLRLPRFVADGLSVHRFARTINFYSSRLGSLLTNTGLDFGRSCRNLLFTRKNNTCA